MTNWLKIWMMTRMMPTLHMSQNLLPPINTLAVPAYDELTELSALLAVPFKKLELIDDDAHDEEPINVPSNEPVPAR